MENAGHKEKMYSENKEVSRVLLRDVIQRKGTDLKMQRIHLWTLDKILKTYLDGSEY